MAEALIHVEDIVKKYRDLRALDGVSLDIGPGVTGLLGPNGAGKTTLIKVLLGLVRCNAGTGTILGLRLGRQTRAIRARIGYMPEDDCYIEGLSGVEMVALAAQLSGLDGIEALRRAHEILDFSGIEQERYRPVSTYSTGMRQKLKFAQAVVHDPPLLILDEPTAGLDPEERRAMLGRVRILSRRAGKAIVISTHILPDVQEICDHVTILARGRVRLSESMEVLSRPASPRYELRVLGDARALAERLRGAGFEITAENGGGLGVASASETFFARLWELAQESGAVVRGLAPSRNSLEEVFLDAVKEVSDADP